MGTAELCSPGEFIQQMSQLTDIQIERTVLKIRRVYLALILISTPGALASIYYADIGVRGEFLVTWICQIFMYFGLRDKKSWIIPLITISSVFSFVFSLLAITEPSKNPIELITKILADLMVFFFVFQIHFFRRKEVGKFFMDSGLDFF